MPQEFDYPRSSALEFKVSLCSFFADSEVSLVLTEFIWLNLRSRRGDSRLTEEARGERYQRQWH